MTCLRDLEEHHDHQHCTRHLDRDLPDRPRPQPDRLRRPARHGHQGPRLVHRARRHRHFDVEDPSRSSLQLTIEAASVDTANPDRDGHLRSDDFLDLEHYPQITFASTAVAQVEPDTYRVNGDLSIKGVTRPVTFDRVYAGCAVDPYGNQRVGFEGSTTINRKDWGVNWNAALEAGGVLVSEKVTLEFDISAIKDAAAA